MYLVERDGYPLYVGMSRLGLSRPLARRHHALRDLKPTDIFYIWKFADSGPAYAFETHLIVRLAPRRNVDGDGTPDFTLPWTQYLEPDQLP